MPGHKTICFYSILRTDGSQVHESRSAMPVIPVPRLSGGLESVSNERTVQYGLYGIMQEKHSVEKQTEISGSFFGQK